jgi:large subunit ribosomal protein L25
MPDSRPSLVAHARTVTGKAVRQLRADGFLPAVVYGHGVPSESVQIEGKAFEDLSRHTSRNTLVDLAVDGAKSRRVLIYDVQHHPVTRRPLHVDLFVVRMTEELTVDVPLNFNGTPPAVDKLLGTLFHAIDAVRVRALPDQLPGSIDVDVHGLATFDDAIHVRDLPLPEGVTLVSEPDDVVAKVLPPRVVEEEAPAEAAEGEEGAEGAEGEEGAEPAAGDEADSGGGSRGASRGGQREENA